MFGFWSFVKIILVEDYSESGGKNNTKIINGKTKQGLKNKQRDDDHIVLTYHVLKKIFFQNCFC
jgi:hypothetical protein